MKYIIGAVMGFLLSIVGRSSVEWFALSPDTGFLVGMFTGIVIGVLALIIGMTD